MQSNIVICGFMGTGKSAVGRIVADRLAFRFVDMDDLIVQREGRSIPAIFRDSGEKYFRKVERDLVRELASSNGLVIATGGGVVLDRRNLEDFSGTGMVVCLTATPEKIFERTKGDTNRPLLAVPDPMARIRELLDKRRPYYSAIPFQIDTTNMSPEQVADEIIRRFRAVGQSSE